MPSPPNIAFFSIVQKAFESKALTTLPRYEHFGCNFFLSIITWHAHWCIPKNPAFLYMTYMIWRHKCNKGGFEVHTGLSDNMWIIGALRGRRGLYCRKLWGQGGAGAWSRKSTNLLVGCIKAAFGWGGGGEVIWDLFVIILLTNIQFESKMKK